MSSASSSRPPRWLNRAALLFGLLGAGYEVFLKPRLRTFGVGRILEPTGNQYCQTVPELSACEKIVLHQPSGVLYLACSTPSSRVHWTPALDRLNSTGASHDDYVASYDPKTSKVTRFKVTNFSSPRGLSLHGMDVVPSSLDPTELFIYLVNHRDPLGDLSASKVGADSVIEVFKATVGGSTLTHIKTVEDPIIITPNDLVGSPDGKSFYFTNDHGTKVGLVRVLDMFGRQTTSIGYCHLDEGCHFAAEGMLGNNGIVRGENGTFYVANCLAGALRVLREGEGHMLTLDYVVPTDRPMDNLSLDSKGRVWAAAFPKALQLVTEHFSDPSIPSPASALRFTFDGGNGRLENGEPPEVAVDKVFEDDGQIASGTTSVAYDAERNLLFLDGLASPHLTVCKL